MPQPYPCIGGFELKWHVLVSLLMVSLPFSGCLGTSNEELICNDGRDTGDDCVLTIVTYDINALSDDVLNVFTNQTGVKIEMIRTDDAGGILELLLLTKITHKLIWLLAWIIRTYKLRYSSIFSPIMMQEFLNSTPKQHNLTME
jgi:hypothetical protein